MSDIRLSPRVTGRYRWLVGVGAVVAALIVVTTLHFGTQISSSAQLKLYRQAVALVTAQRRYALAHGAYAVSVTDLATSDASMAFAVAPDSPVLQYNPGDGGHGYFANLANQSTGGAANFAILMMASNKAILTCTGPAPLCSNGRFRIPRRDYALNVESQRTLYRQMVTLLTAEHDFAAANNGGYSQTMDLATHHRADAFLVGPGNPVTQFDIDFSGHGYFVELSNQASGGGDSFSALVPEHGAPILTCVGQAPLCSHSTFKVPSGTLGTSAAGRHQ